MRENQTKSISELETLKKDLNDIFKKKLKAEKKRNSVKNQLDENLLPKLTELQNVLSSRSPEGASTGLAVLSRSEEKGTLQQVRAEIRRVYSCNRYIIKEDWKNYSLMNMRQLQILFNYAKTWHRIVFFRSAEQFYEHIMQKLEKR